MLLVGAPLAAIAATVVAVGGQRPLRPSCRRRWAHLDDLHRRRDDKSAWSEQQRLVQSLIARAPGRPRRSVARGALLFLGQRRPVCCRDQRSRWGKDGWDLAERAIAVNPNDVAGYYWAALCMGNYAMGLGALKALSQGMEAKFRDRLARAQALNPAYEANSAAWGGLESCRGRSATARRRRSTCGAPST